MRQPAVVIHMQMGEDDAFDIARADTECAQLRTDFLFGLDPECDLPADVGMQRLAGFEQMRALPGIDDENAIAAVNDPRISRQPPIER